MLCFFWLLWFLVFLALTLTSLSWFGAQAANYCQLYYDEYCYTNQSNNHTEDFFSTINGIVLTRINDTSSGGETDIVKTCADIENGYCGKLT